MAVDRQRLEDFLHEHEKDPALIDELRVMERLEPFFQHAENDRYSLQLESELDAEIVAKAISMATGKEVKKVIPVSYGNPLEMSVWIIDSDEVYGVRFQGSLWKNLGEILADSLGTSLWNDFRKNFSNNLRYSLIASLNANIYTCPGGSLWEGICFFAGFALVGDRENAEKLIPLIKLLPHAIPLGEMPEEPGIWYVLVA